MVTWAIPEKMDVEELNLSNRAYKALRAANILTVEQLVKMSEVELNRFWGLGQLTRKEIIRALADRGLCLKPVAPPRRGAWRNASSKRLREIIQRGERGEDTLQLLREYVNELRPTADIDHVGLVGRRGVPRSLS